MTKRRKDSKGSRGSNPRVEWIIYPLLISIVIAVPIWAFTPVDGFYLAWIIGVSVSLFGMYGYDKSRSRKMGRRIPEFNLHLWAFLGGFTGGLIGMYFFRHKTRKPSFLMVIVGSALTHLAVVLFGF